LSPLRLASLLSFIESVQLFLNFGDVGGLRDFINLSDTGHPLLKPPCTLMGPGVVGLQSLPYPMLQEYWSPDYTPACAHVIAHARALVWPWSPLIE